MLRSCSAAAKGGGSDFNIEFLLRAYHPVFPAPLFQLELVLSSGDFLSLYWSFGHGPLLGLYLVLIQEGPRLLEDLLTEPPEFQNPQSLPTMSVIFYAPD